METKPGPQTTEFWVTIFTGATQALNLFGLWDYVPNSVSVYALAIIGGLYAVSRGIAKQGIKPT